MEMATNRCPVCGANLREKREISDFHWHVNCDRCGEFEIGRRVMDDFNEEEPYKVSGWIYDQNWTAPGLLDTRVRVFDLMRPPQLERVFPALPGPAFGSRSPRESNDGCIGS